MKILKNNYDKAMWVKEPESKKEPYPRKRICNNCGSELEYEENDIRIGALGCAYIDCPLCHYDIMIEENEKAITLTVDNIEFPTHFFHTSKEDGAVDCCNNDEVKKCIRKAINYFRNNKDEFAWFTESGNLRVDVSRYDGDEDYYAIVTNNYYSTYIPFEPEDY